MPRLVTAGEWAGFPIRKGQQPSAPPEFVALIQSQLSLLPEDATVSLSAYGHTGWGADQIAGEISLHCAINVTTPRAHQPEPG